MEKPTKPCYVCGSDNWWWRPAGGLGGPGGWLCGKCHPNPNKEAGVAEEKGHCKHGEFELREGCPLCIAERRQDPGSGSNSEEGKSAPEMVVISDQPGESHLVPEPPATEEKYSPETLALRDRVISGNKKLNDAWEQIRQLAGESQEWKNLFEQWGQANVKLSALCDELKLRGYEDCLYLNDQGKKTKKCLPPGDDMGCRVCPSSRKYSEEELMALPGPKAYPVKQEEDGQTEFLKTLGGKE